VAQGKPGPLQLQPMPVHATRKHRNKNIVPPAGSRVGRHRALVFQLLGRLMFSSKVLHLRVRLFLFRVSTTCTSSPTSRPGMTNTHSFLLSISSFLCSHQPCIMHMHRRFSHRCLLCRCSRVSPRCHLWALHLREGRLLKQLGNRRRGFGAGNVLIIRIR
jgi:hypothetical protein